MIKIYDLILAGVLPAGTRLSWKRRGGSNFMAEITANGTIKTADGRLHKTPSGAARSLIGRPVDGWAVWRTNDGTTLSEFRSKLAKDQSNL